MLPYLFVGLHVLMLLPLLAGCSSPPAPPSPRATTTGSDGRPIIASSTDFVELDALLSAMGENPELLPFEFIDVDDSFVTGPETI